MKRSQKQGGALPGISEVERRIMGNLLRMAPEQQKAAAKPSSGRAQAQRRRRERERGALPAVAQDKRTDR
jgi:hypothetical protein